ncbi:MAG: sulfur oxidation c-type cytochrome SoxA [Bradyrhizobiaceae bacterium]|nr:sulfur oxidation c-type cytochrome SoxA [Bradyrhizobiaceae bacterium]
MSKRTRSPRLLSAICLALLAAATPGASGEIAQADRRSDYDFMSRDTQAMQDDDSSNPGMLWVQEGEALWSRKEGSAQRSCMDCHGDARTSMKGVAARYPVFDAERARPIDLDERIISCRMNHQNATPFAYESKELLALEAYIARQSRGMPIETGDDERLEPFIVAGREIFNRRQGQLNISCAQCHDDNWGKRLAGNTVPQAHPTGYPLYRLEWQTLGSLQRRLRACMFGVRAEPYPFGAPENIALETFLMSRAHGMPMDAPAVRP